MAFTDEDLKRLKELLDDTKASGFFTEDMARGIIARLEAAEEIASYFANHPDSAHWWPYAQGAIEAWRKTCGR